MTPLMCSKVDHWDPRVRVPGLPVCYGVWGFLLLLFVLRQDLTM